MLLKYYFSLWVYNKALLTEILVHTGNICSDVQGAWTHCVRSIRLERQNKYFLVWTSRSVNKSIISVLKASIAIIQKLENKTILVSGTQTMKPKNFPKLEAKHDIAKSRKMPYFVNFLASQQAPTGIPFFLQ